MTTIQLDPKKVFRQFGPHPEKGKVMKIFTTTTSSAGVRTQFKKLIQNPIQVWPVLTLNRMGSNKWAVQIKPEYLRQALQWLRHNCQ